MAREDTQFKAGKSGNPKGRPPSKSPSTAKLRADARGFNDEALMTLVSAMRDTSLESKERVKASLDIIEIGNGKAPQALQVELEDKTEPKPVVIEHVGMTQEQVDKTYPHEAKARKERLEREARETNEYNLIALSLDSKPTLPSVKT